MKVPGGETTVSSGDSKYVEPVRVLKSFPKSFALRSSSVSIVLYSSSFAKASSTLVVIA